MRHKMLQHPFNSAELVYNPSWYPVVAKALGEPLTLLYSGVMFARALQDAEPQGWHADGEQLCPDVRLPPHCLNVFVPLVELTPENGSTEFCPGAAVSQVVPCCAVKATRRSQASSCGDASPIMIR